MNMYFSPGLCLYIFNFPCNVCFSHCHNSQKHQKPFSVICSLKSNITNGGKNVSNWVSCVKCEWVSCLTTQGHGHWWVRSEGCFAVVAGSFSVLLPHYTRSRPLNILIIFFKYSGFWVLHLLGHKRAGYTNMTCRYRVEAMYASISPRKWCWWKLIM